MSSKCTMNCPASWFNSEEGALTWNALRNEITNGMRKRGIRSIVIKAKKKPRTAMRSSGTSKQIE